MLRVGLEARVLNGPLTGVGNYTLGILQALAANYPELTLVGYGVRHWRVLDSDSLRQIEGSSETSTIAEKFETGRSRRLIQKLKRKARPVISRLGLAQSMYRRQFARTVGHQSLNLFHAFNYLPVAQPEVVTLPVIYDLSFIRFPQFHPVDRLRILERLPWLLERSPRVQTISEFTRNEIANYYGYDREEIFVAPPAASKFFRPLGPDVTARDIERFRVSPGSYLLSVGTLEPRKNLKTLISAYSVLPKRLRERMPLLVVGGKGWGELDLPSTTNSLVEEGSLRFTGSVSNRELRSLYEGAISLLYPSVYEGFGMPVVECMACGTSVVHSAGTSMDEITCGLALTAEANNVDTWAEVVKKIASRDNQDVEEDSERLIARAAQFNWSRSAELVRAAYEDLILTKHI